MVEEWEEDGFIEEVTKPKKFEDEKEEIERKKQEPKVEKPKEDDITDYEFKWKQKHKDAIEDLKELEKAVQGLDEKKKAEILEERRRMMDLEDFSNEKVDKKKITKNQKLLETESDFIKLADKVSARLNSNPKTFLKYQATFLKETLDHLGSMLDLKTVNDMIKELTKTFNQKRTKESGKKPSQKTKQKPKIVAGKGVDTVKSQNNNDFGDDAFDDEYDDEDYIK
jgi:hypothetical protein